MHHYITKILKKFLKKFDILLKIYLKNQLIFKIVK